jgi:hypothetical protein
MKLLIMQESYGNCGLDDRGGGVQFSAGTFLICIVPRRALGHAVVA